MSETPQMTDIPTNEQLRQGVLGDEADPGATEVAMEARARRQVEAAYPDGEMERVGGNNPESHIDLHAEAETSSFLSEHEHEKAESAAEQQRVKDSRIESYMRGIEGMTVEQLRDYVNSIGASIHNIREWEADS